ncbi:zeta toxin family protein [Sinorhizobium sp. Sb3]|uniref:zeta toxin family protein n=1 Tax=Sinorhizobium sp. Sb3 TaxID=1358417 RepID=UPI0012E3F444|nr:zeta toxin family protein [Sinorhizobium sp. Sb3]
MSADRCAHIYDHKIAPENLVKEGVRGRPQFWIIAGENGIGKTTNMEKIADRLTGPTQKISPDDLVKYVDGYHEYAAKDPALAQEDAREFTPEWCDRLRDDAGEKGAHILIECSMPGGMQADIEFAESWGYETGLYLIAEPRAISWTAVVDRTDKALNSGQIGTSAMVSDRGHTQRYAAWPRAIFDAEQDVSFDHITIARRDGTVMYHNHREQRGGTKRWVREPQGLEVLLLERHRGLSFDQVQWLEKM